MSVYVDTSVLVAAHCSEKYTGLAQGWLEELSDAELIISTWTLLECESALAIKVRRQELDLSNQSAVLADIQAFADMYAPFPVPDEQDYGQARKFCRLAGCGLRAGDALHLALALRLETRQFLTLDHLLGTNAVAQGFAVFAVE
ncbi:type II toxin-antitoxin system VapC family toxin [Acidithiobacillus thiooxidans]|uniref:type II toxin-antitoxin system VapC family toxin n=1 Tax=Acidithiobacillus thiooxidans TaxID=930 RepID=UPI001C07B62C|nr:type II toxin-antitoxin system VapC family toxin [Acidithiobacillus thiooxidans]MBU2839951.1 type II toxin-antitoxin system VapC family toxin [Acidithiobacillus thiooxidans]